MKGFANLVQFALLGIFLTISRVQAFQLSDIGDFMFGSEGQSASIEEIDKQFENKQQQNSIEFRETFPGGSYFHLRECTKMPQGASQIMHLLEYHIDGKMEAGETIHLDAKFVADQDLDPKATFRYDVYIGSFPISVKHKSGSVAELLERSNFHGPVKAGVPSTLMYQIRIPYGSPTGVEYYFHSLLHGINAKTGKYGILGCAEGTLSLGSE